MYTSPRFNNVKGNASEMVTTSGYENDAQQRMAVVEWIKAIVPHIRLSVQASDEELRASLLDGDTLCQILIKLKYTSIVEGDDSSPSPETKRRKILRFIANVSKIGLPSFLLSDLEKGSMRPVLECLTALKEHSMPNFCSSAPKAMDDRRKYFADAKFQRPYSPCSPGSPSLNLQGGNKFHEVFQMKQGFYTDFPPTKLAELMKSSSLDNAPTQSLLSVMNGILEESIERKNAEIPQRVACLLRKVVQEIERRIATQAEHLKTQNNLYKAREEKYHSRIRVLEALAKGTSKESEIAMNQLQHAKSQTEKSKVDDKKKVDEPDIAKLKKQMEEQEVAKLKKQMEEQEVAKLKKQMEEQEVGKLKKQMEEQEIAKLKKQMEEQEIAKLKKQMEEQAVAELKRQKEEQAAILDKHKEEQAAILNKQMEEQADILKQKEEQAVILKKQKEEQADILKQKEEQTDILNKKMEEQAAILKKHKKESAEEMSTLKQELELAKKTHELRYLELQTEAKSVKNELENRLRQQEKLVEDSKVKMKEIEVSSQSKCQIWVRKEHKCRIFMDSHFAGLEDLRQSSEGIKQEMLIAQRTYTEELNLIGTKLKKLSEAAQSYHQVLNENRKLYNELMDLRGNIRVYCRVRPFRSWENSKQTVIEHVGENGELTVINPAKPKDSQKSFRFNKTYGQQATQADVFSDTQPLIRTILDGYNVCIFAYGQTGSGKTYTMSGPDNASKEDWGVNYRALDDLFQISEDRRNFFLYEIGVQMIEIYNETIRDLLSSDSSQKKLGILATPQSHGLAVPDASLLPVQSTQNVIELMNIGLGNRSVSATAMNERSSRSHSVVTVHVQGKDLKTGSTTHGSLHLVDLAGSERVDRSDVTGDRLREAQHINKSLAALGDVIFALAQKSPHVPYRNSKLTQVLQASLGGRAKTLMFVQVNPDVNSYTETLSTLKFAERVSAIELGAAKSSKEGKDVKDLLDQVASLKDTIAGKDEEIERLHSKSPGDEDEGGNEGGIQPSRSLGDFKSQRDSPNYSRRTSGVSVDDDDIVSGDDERSSEVSDGDFSIGTDTDSAVDVSLSPSRSRQTDIADKRREKPKNPSRISQSSRLQPSTGASRLSLVKTNPRTSAALKKAGNGSSSPVTASRRRP